MKSATDAEKSNASEEEAVVVGEVSEQETPAQEPEGAIEDSEKQATTATSEEYKTKYEELVHKYEKDIGSVKSVLDKRINETQRNAEERERSLKAQLDEIRKKTLNEDDYKEYEKNRALERIDELQKELEHERMEKEQVKQYNYYLNYFTRELGIQDSELKTDGTLEELFNSGMAAVKDNVKRLRDSKPAEATVTKEGKKPPVVAKSSSSPATGVLSLEEAAKKYAGGSISKLYDMAERDAKLANIITEAARKLTQ